MEVGRYEVLSEHLTHLKHIFYIQNGA